MRSFILASSSNIRSHILREAGFSFDVIASHVREWEEESANSFELVLSNAKKKACYVAKSHRDDIVLGVDTVVSAQGQTLCKPNNFDDALRMFEYYQKGQIIVCSGLTLCYQGECVSACEETKIFLRKYSKEQYMEILPKIFSEKKSGGFGIEGLGSILLDNIEGSFYNVLGLPLHVVYDLAQQLSINILDFWKKNES